MYANMSFDEINELAGQRSMDYERFFGEMRISEEQKRRRIELARLLEDAFIDALVIAFVMEQEDNLEVDLVKDYFVQSYRETLTDRGFELDNYLTEHIDRFSEEAAEATERHFADPYYFSEDRAKVMGENEANAVLNYIEHQEQRESGKRFKMWRTVIDGKERDTHAETDGVIVGIDEVFTVGDSVFRFPRDTMYNPSPEESVNCRCSIDYYERI